MPTSFTRCQYISGDGRQCQEWFPQSFEERARFCTEHAKIDSISSDESKQTFIAKLNSHRQSCAQMTIDELERHIASIEVIISEKKTELHAARGVQADKLETLTEEQRAERRKYIAPKPPSSDKPKKTKTASLTNLGLDLRMIENLKSMSVEEMMAKFAKAKESNQ